MAITFDRDNKYIFITAPQTTVTIQDLVNAIRDYEDELPLFDLTHLANATGKQDLGGGVSVGITLELRDGWTIKFEARAGPTTITCTITGGNLAQVAGVFPITDSAFVFVIVSTSSSATIAELQIANLQRLIETQRSSHIATGDVYYWDPFAGSDNLAGTSPTTPKATFSATLGLCTSYNHDMIVCQPGDPSGPTVTAEELIVDKAHVLVRGPGNDFRIEPVGAKDTVQILADGVELNSLRLSGPTTGKFAGIEVSGADNVLLKDLFITGSSHDGICVLDSENSFFDNVKIYDVAEDGFHVGAGVGKLDIKNPLASHAGSQGIHLSGCYETKVRGKGMSLTENGAYGLFVDITADDTLIDVDGTVTNNFSGNIADLGAGTSYSGVDKSAAYAGRISINTIIGVSGTNYPRGTQNTPSNNLADALAIGAREGLSIYELFGPLTFDQDFENKTLRGAGSPARDVLSLGGYSVNQTFLDHLNVDGTGSGEIHAHECSFSGSGGLIGRFIGGFIVDNYTMHSTGTLILKGVSAGGPNGATIDTVGSERIIGAAGLDGVWTLSNMKSGPPFPGSIGHMSFTGGELEVSASCTGGILQVDGIVNLTNSGSGIVVEEHEVSQPSIAGATWDEGIVPEHTASNSAGEFLYGAGGGSSPSAIAAEVWNTATVAHTGSGTFGEKVANGLLTFVKWIALKKN